MANNINTILQSAVDDGNLSLESFDILGNIDITEQIQSGMGIVADDVPCSETVLLSIMPDDSGSISCIRKNPASLRSKVVGPDLMMNGHNLILDTINTSKQQDNVLALNRYLNGKVLYSYRPLSQALKMDKNNYKANGGTPLYDQTVIFLGTVLAKVQDLENAGIVVRTISLIISDGEDLHSINHGAKDCALLIRDMVDKELSNHMVAAMGIDDGQTDFRRVFKEMGIPDHCILTPENDPKDIMNTFNLFSQSAARFSQNASTFSQGAMGGFAAA